MTRRTVLEHRFVDAAPEHLDDGVVYVSIPYATALHRCACGCGTEVVTPLSPGGWTLLFDGRTVSLQPSIGNGNLTCRSHYWIRNDRVQWVPHRPGATAGQGRPVVHVPTGLGDHIAPAAPSVPGRRRWISALLARLWDRIRR
ncbi:DUF6527 family protein [Actinoplanes sp. NPDC026670]|uniref:DUF6527 family protein n=1 Tax=Actinoplanes sp. NPDC026670 TaxID=3154700 RepID=UPI0033C96BCD